MFVFRMNMIVSYQTNNHTTVFTPASYLIHLLGLIFTKTYLITEDKCSTHIISILSHIIILLITHRRRFSEVTNPRTQMHVILAILNKTIKTSTVTVILQSSAQLQACMHLASRMPSMPLS